MLIASYGETIAAAAQAVPPASKQANCFVESGADRAVGSSMSTLATAVNAAPPGRNILIAPGTYSGGTRTFTRNGAEGSPIVIRPQNGLGTVTINGGTWTLANTSS
jgi:Chondroitinase B